MASLVNQTSTAATERLQSSPLETAKQIAGGPACKSWVSQAHEICSCRRAKLEAGLGVIINR